MAKKDLILAIDEGTTGVTCVLVNQNLKHIAETSFDFQQHFPKPGWVEHDPDQIWAAVLKCIKKIAQKADLNRIAAIGITNQRETICFWDKKTKKTLSPAIVWQDRRTAEFCQSLKSDEPFFQTKTGLLLDPYFSGTKVHWAIKNWGQVKTALDQGRLCVGTIDTFLLFKLTDGKSYATEPSNASRTLCFDILKQEFSSELCKKLGFTNQIWAESLPSVGNFGVTQNLKVLPDGIPITGILGDQQAALLGQACFNPGSAKCTYGTGAFLLFNTGNQKVESKHRLLTTIAWKLPTSLAHRSGVSETTYALEGSAFIAGAATQWLRDGLKLIKTADEIETLAKKVKTTDGVVFVPSLVGWGAPHWNPKSRGLFTGLTRGTTPAHLARAIIEGIALQNVDILESMQKDLGSPLKSLNVDGGAAMNSLLMQFQADVLKVELKRPRYLETTSLGAVFAAGLGAGIWSDLSQIQKSWKLDRIFKPKMLEDELKLKLKNWKIAVKQSLMTEDLS